ncbi:MAG: cob(I)yrinic acid a,c-diamide adenosyltransferase [Deltaproteobacteria bacterium]|nr:cob(I)yrinic acid a,c-diamide adenosyltransferase [Deltaproteobacteria bacterium]
MKIYTKTGDDGTTALFDGTRVDKNNPRVDTYGDIDELNAMLGIVVSGTADPEFTQLIRQIQRDLFALGAQLANPSHKKLKAKADFSEDKITSLEKAIDKCDAEFGPIKTFMLPGGSPTAARFEFARTLCRRAERRVVSLSKNVEIKPDILIYLNRLSDLLFMLARVANKREGIQDIPWDG